jgi:hypothetical protein
MRELQFRATHYNHYLNLLIINLILAVILSVVASQEKAV